MVAGRAVGLWDMNSSKIELGCKEYHSQISDDERDMRHEKWKMAVERSLGWDTK